MVGNEDFFFNFIVHSPIELELALALISNYPWQLEKIILIHAAWMLYLNSILVIFFLGVRDDFIFLIQIGLYLQIFPPLKLLLRQLLFLWLQILFISTCFAQVLIRSLQTFGCLRSLWC